VAGPTTDKSLVKNKIVVKDGSTVVLAGLIKDQKDRTRTQPPLLGDIPLVSWVFGKRNNIVTKKNLVVLVTPHIVKEHSDLDRISRYKLGEYRDTNIEKLFKDGFFKKIKAKRQLRKQHHPTFERVDAVIDQNAEPAFSKGEIKR
jgi:type II secretory pathway component GspD/PulD (secretin)